LCEPRLVLHENSLRACDSHYFTAQYHAQYTSPFRFVRMSRDTMEAAGHEGGANRTSSSAKLLWRHADPASTPMTKYLQHVNHAYSLQLSTYPELHKWSIEHIDAFWESVWKFVGVRAEGSATPVSSSKQKSLYVIDDNRQSTQMYPCFLDLHSSGMRA
jgi:hypothetical protein